MKKKTSPRITTLESLLTNHLRNVLVVKTKVLRNRIRGHLNNVLFHPFSSSMCLRLAFNYYDLTICCQVITRGWLSWQVRGKPAFDANSSLYWIKIKQKFLNNLLLTGTANNPVKIILNPSTRHHQCNAARWTSQSLYGCVGIDSILWSFLLCAYRWDHYWCKSKITAKVAATLGREYCQAKD